MTILYCLLYMQYAPTETRQALIRVIDLGSRSISEHGGGAVGSRSVPPPPSPSPSLHASSRFPHLCLSKLYVLCSRGQDSDPKEQSVRCQLEVAQLALPVFIARAERVMRRYGRGYGGGRGGQLEVAQPAVPVFMARAVRVVTHVQVGRWSAADPLKSCCTWGVALHGALLL